MRKIALTILSTAVLLAALAQPAAARISVGLVPDAAMPDIDRAATIQLADALSGKHGQPVTIREFTDSVAITNWLLRFQEIDAAIVPLEYIHQQPAGTLSHLADLHLKKGKTRTLALVIRRTLNKRQAALIKDSFLDLDNTNNGRSILGKFGITAVTLPGKRPQQAKVKKTPRAVVKKPAEEVISKPQEKAAPTPLSTGVNGTKKPVPVDDDFAHTLDDQPPQKEKTAAKTDPVPDREQVTAPEKEQIRAQGPSAEKPISQPPQPEQKTDQRLVIFAALLVLIAILFKLGLLVLRWQSKRFAASEKNTPSVETVLEQTAATAKTVAVKTETKEPLVIEAGTLGSGKVPELLKRCADLPEPAVLTVTKGSSKKMVYFAAGQVSGALTQNSATKDPGVRWSKLGSLLVRDKLISSEERDQGLALLTQKPDLRLGEALLKLKLIDLAGLRHALTRQAKVTIYALILFPEGRYQVFSGVGSLPPEESVALEINNLIREASHHQSEWTAIRQSLPTLNTVLQFSSAGQDRVKNANLTSGQLATLELVDGKRSINDLCIESTMMDYEVYRFLYLMVKAGVLQ